MAYYSDRDRTLVFVDVETTGLDPSIHEAIEIAAIAIDPKFKAAPFSFEAKIQPQAIEKASPEALLVNKYSPIAWKDARSLTAVMSDYLAFLPQEYTLIGHNIAFDWSFVRASLRRSNLNKGYFPRLLDTKSMAWPLMARGIIENTSLKACCKHFQIDQIGAHSAMGDVRATFALYRFLVPQMV